MLVSAADQTALLGALPYDINGDGIVTYVQSPYVPIPVNSSSVPTSLSTAFTVGGRAQATTNLIVRSAAGNAQPFVGNINSGNQGTVIGGPVYVDNNWWWRVSFDSNSSGWTIEPYLSPTATLAPPPPPPPPTGLSTKFKAGDIVGATTNLNVRQTPSTSGAFIGLIPPNTTQGTITATAPVFADGYWWWQTTWTSGISGWSVQNYMKEFIPPPAPTITNPTNNSYSSTSVNTVNGVMPAAEVGGAVGVRSAGSIIGTSVIGTSGLWQFSRSFSDGIYALVASATDQSLNVGPNSSTITFPSTRSRRLLRTSPHRQREAS